MFFIQCKTWLSCKKISREIAGIKFLRKVTIQQWQKKIVIETWQNFQAEIRYSAEYCSIHLLVQSACLASSFTYKWDSDLFLRLFQPLINPKVKINMEISTQTQPRLSNRVLASRPEAHSYFLLFQDQVSKSNKAGENAPTTLKISHPLIANHNPTLSSFLQKNFSRQTNC